MSDNFKGTLSICLVILSVVINLFFSINTSKLEQTNKILINNINNTATQLRKITSDFETRLMIADIVTNCEYKKVTATCYSPSIDETDSTPFITASGDRVHTTYIAVSRDLYKNGWKFGSMVYIKELNQFFIVKDLMNKRYEKRIDYFAWTKPEAKEHGIKQHTAYLIE